MIVVCAVCKRYYSLASDDPQVRMIRPLGGDLWRGQRPPICMSCYGKIAWPRMPLRLSQQGYSIDLCPAA